MKTSVVAIAAGLLSALSRKEDRPAVIPSIKIKQVEEIKNEWSKRTQQRMKGKDARMSRGRNRKPQDAVLYASLRR